MIGRRIRLLILPLAALAGAAALLAAAAAPASADAPSRTGWWNRASAGSAAAPYPAAQQGQLHVGNNPNGPGAYAAVHFTVNGTSAPQATLTLGVAANSTVGTPKLVACPTKTSTWKAGGDQPWPAAPAYNCAAGHSTPGTVATDGNSVTWTISSSQQTRPGELDLAILPQPGDQDTFGITFTKPGASALQTTSSGGGAPPSISSRVGNGPGTGTSSGVGAGSGKASNLSPAVPSGGLGVTTSHQPSGNVQLPTVAPGTGNSQGRQISATPAGLTKPLDRRMIALAAFFLIAMALLYVGLRQQRYPLGLIGATPGRGADSSGTRTSAPTTAADSSGTRTSAPTTAADSSGTRTRAPTTAKDPGLTVTAPVRGLGRFVGPRTRPPRPL